jgi:Holliday junction resolvase RusA-like endonuclease
MNEFTIEIPGEPISKARPRFRRQGNFVRTYDIQHFEKEQLKTLFKCAITNQKGWGPGIALSMTINCYFKAPKSFSTKQRNLISWNALPHTSKPDGSNILKMYEDAMNEIVFDDDRQLISITVNKFYSNESKTVISIMPKISYDEAIKEFEEIINFENFCSLSSEIYHLAYVLKERKEMRESEKLDYTKLALLKLGNLADHHGKLLCEIAKKHKSLIKKIEQDYDMSYSMPNPELSNVNI